MKTVSFKAAGGIRNTVEPERLKPTDLVTGVNIDLDESGAVMRRKGLSKLIAGSTHSLYGLGGSGLMVQSGALKQFYPDGTSNVLRSSMADTRVNYAQIMSTVYWSNEHQSGIVEAGICRNWGVTPPPPPVLVPTVGALPAGRYSVAATYVRDDGHESGARESKQIDVADNAGVLVALTPSLDPNVVAIRLYVSSVNGTVLYRYGEYAATASNATITQQPQDELPLLTQFYGPPPTGQQVAFFAGRMYVAKDNFLFYSLPYEYELFDLRYGFVPFEDRVTMVAPVTNGIFLGTTKQVNFLQGMTPEEFKTSKVYGFGAIEGTHTITKADYVIKDAQPDPCALWLGHDGVCVGLAVGQSNNLTGQVKNLTAERYEYSTTSQAGASVLKLRNGTPHFVVSTF